MVDARDARADTAEIFGANVEYIVLGGLQGRIGLNLPDEEEKRNPAEPSEDIGDGPVGFDSFSSAVEWWKFS